MPLCKSQTKSGKFCKLSVTKNGFCHLHYVYEPNYRNIPKPDSCIVCLENMVNVKRPLPCGHWIHKKCIQQTVDSLQQINFNMGLPPLQHAQCPLCKLPIKFIVPTPNCTLPPHQIYIIPAAALQTAYTNWRNNDQAALSFYIWVELCTLYPQTNPELLIQICNMMCDLIVPEFATQNINN